MSTDKPAALPDPDLGPIGPGHVCKHGIRWPHACQPCADAAWEAEKLKGSASGLGSRIAGAAVAFGLRAQGHMETIANMLTMECPWSEIGKEIGWHPETAREWYERELAMEKPTPAADGDEAAHLRSLKVGERVIEIGQSMTTGWTGTTFLSETPGHGMCVRWDNEIDGGHLSTSVTHGTRRISDVLKAAAQADEFKQASRDKAGWLLEARKEIDRLKARSVTELAADHPNLQEYIRQIEGDRDEAREGQTINWNSREAWREKAEGLEVENERMKALLNTPETTDFIKSVTLEAAHQRERWPSEQDAGKSDPDWFWLIGYLAGKALHNLGTGNKEKGLHHVITTAAACCNWHRQRTVGSDMRPGVAEVAP